MSQSTCRCGTEIVKAMTPKGSWMPVVMAPSSEDHADVLLLAPRGLAGTLLAVTLSGEGLERCRDAGLDLRINHFKDCPDRENFRRAKTTTKGTVA